MKILHVAVILIATIVAFFLLENYHRNSAKAAFSSSNGTFDDQAEKALDSLERLQCPTPKDHYLAARIIDLNGHDGKINNVRVLNDVVGRYMYNLKPYTESQRIIEKDPLDWFELDQIENFMERHMDIMKANPEHNNFIEAVLQARPKKVLKTVESAKETSDNKKEAFELYAQTNITHTSDPQNVHDSAVNEQLRNSWKFLKKTTPPLLDKKLVFPEIRAYIENSIEDPQRRKRALKSLDVLQDGKYNSTIGTTEDDITTTVWTRSKLPKNKENLEKIRDAVVNSLSEMSEDGHSVVCSNGRCARLLESLLFTDDDANGTSGAMTTEQLRNEALKLSNDILQKTIQEFSKSNDQRMRSVAESYREPTVVTDIQSENAFKDIVKKEIIESLDNSFKTKLSSRDYTNLLNQCLTAIDSI